MKNNFREKLNMIRENNNSKDIFAFKKNHFQVNPYIQ